MRNTLLLAGILAGAALPIMASAQPYDRGCVEANHANRVAGTVIGGVLGAVIGSNIAGRGSRGAGAVIGGAAGAVAGNAVAGSNSQPCPPGYTWQGPPPEPAAYGFWRGAPTGIHSRIAFMQQRLDTAGQRGWISRGEYRDLSAELDSIRREDARLRYRDGGHLYPRDRDYLQGQLDDMSARLHWAARG